VIVTHALALMTTRSATTSLAGALSDNNHSADGRPLSGMSRG
jgi:hypothetical protein